MQRPKLQVRVEPDVLRSLDRISAALGKSRSAVVRELLNEAGPALRSLADAAEQASLLRDGAVQALAIAAMTGVPGTENPRTTNRGVQKHSGGLS